MKVSVQTSALADLRKGFWFYEGKESGLGGYFLDSIHSDIDSLQLYAGIHLCVSVAFIGYWLGDFLAQYIKKSRLMSPA